ncbi:MAG: hypothetical protein GF331_10770 [Chitinivibrionales bacterium]|nr:hypothetical protein [Chitinivibrionales bacterium]
MYRIWPALILACCLTASGQSTTTFESGGCVVSVEVAVPDVQIADFTGAELDSLDDEILLHVNVAESGDGEPVLYPCRLGEVKRCLADPRVSLQGDTAERNVALFRQLRSYLQ